MRVILPENLPRTFVEARNEDCQPQRESSYFDDGEEAKKEVDEKVREGEEELRRGGDGRRRR